MKRILSNNYPAITVITNTKGRVKLLKRAIESVKKQNYKGKIFHFIYIDDCKETLEFLESNYRDDNSIYYFYYKRNENDLSGPSLLARLRNDAIFKCKTEWFSFLDDDNEYCVNHLQDLMDFAIENKCDAVFSNSKIYNRDGSPFIKKYWQWERNPDIARIRWEKMRKEGVVYEGSNEMHFKYGVVIDTNVWLMKRQVVLDNKISDYFSEEDWINNLAEDDKLMYGLYNNHVRVLGNNKPTVKYYLGGYSNVFDGSEEGTIIWNKVK